MKNKERDHGEETIREFLNGNPFMAGVFTGYLYMHSPEELKNLIADVVAQNYYKKGGWKQTERK